MKHALSATAIVLMLGSCVGTPAPVPAPARPPVVAAPRPSLPAGPAAERFAGDWSVADLPVAEWRYARQSGISAARLIGTSATDVRAMLSCEGGNISIIRPGLLPADIAAMMTVRTSAAERRLPMNANPANRTIYATLSARDPLWDQIAYSRGRFVIEATAQAPLLAPVRPELLRVIEDCRG